MVDNNKNIHDLQHYAKHGIPYSSVLNRLCITKTSDHEYDLTLRPKIMVFDRFPTFYKVEVKEINGAVTEINGHYNFIVYSIFAFMSVAGSLIGWDIDKLYSFGFITQAAVVVAFKIYGYHQLKSICRKLFTVA